MAVERSLAGGSVILGGKLRVVRLIGCGAMGAVYEVEHEMTKHRRALKVLSERYRHMPELSARFVREASAAGRIGNPHIAETFDAGTLESGEPYLLMEMLRGESLGAHLEKQGRISVGELADIAIQACEGVHAANESGIVHRDLKPDNLFLTRRNDAWFVKVLDFGISKFDVDLTGAGLTREGATIGTPQYMPPEQLDGVGDLDARADIYALGVILYEAATGKRPFDAPTLGALAWMIHHGSPLPMRSLHPELPEAFASVVERAMHCKRELRFHSAAELAAALAPFREVVAWSPTELSPGRAIVLEEPLPAVSEKGSSGPGPSLREGDVLVNKYRVDRIIGRGGMGVVVAAHHIKLDEKVAIKLLLPEMLADPDAVGRFEREARAAVKIKSEHVARVLDVGTLEHGAPFMVMELLEGGDLAAWLNQRGALPVEKAVEFVLQACVAVADAHSLGIIHRDLKPANLFCVQRNDGQLAIKVLDFGISKINHPGGPIEGSITKTGAIMGSPHYMSPEQMQSSGDVDSTTDIWALGVILYHLLTGQVPFPGTTLPGIAIKVANDTPQSPRQIRPEVPVGLEAVIFRCLRKGRRERYRDVAELAVALRPFAPKRAWASVERISGILQAAGRTSGGLSSPPTPSPREDSPSVSGTIAPVGGTVRAKERSSVALLGVLGAVGAATLIGLRAWYVGAAPPATSALGTQVEVPGSAASSTAPKPPTAPPPTAPEPEPIETRVGHRGIKPAPLRASAPDRNPPTPTPSTAPPAAPLPTLHAAPGESTADPFQTLHLKN